jgi:hypothetical protein
MKQLLNVEPPKEDRAKVFIGCSVEAMRAAQAVQNNLQYAAFAKIWSQNTFKLSQTSIESLIKDAPTYDFAVFILSPDDVTTSRDVEERSPRDNVIFETGLFMGVIGRERVFLVKRNDVKVKLPSDLLGLKAEDYLSPPSDSSDDWEAALAPATNRIEAAIKERKTRAAAQQVAKIPEEKVQDAAEFFDKLLIEKYGVSAIGNSMALEVLDDEGSAKLKINRQGIKVSGGVKLDQIPGMVAPGAPGGKITRHPELKPVTFTKAVFLKPKVQTDGLSEFDIVISNSLTNLDPALDFEYESEVEKFCLMTREEVEEAYQKSDFRHEFVSLRIEMPTDKTLLEVTFPEWYRVDAYPGVFFGESMSMHDIELYRVNGGFEKTPRGARFTINKPLPSQQDFDKMRPRA